VGVFVGFAVGLLAACGAPGGPVVGVSVAPTVAMLETSASRTFTATVTGAIDPSVTWTATCGSVSGSGATITYTAPGTEGTCTVLARSVEDPTRTGQATVTVVAAAAGGTWDRQFGTSDHDEALAVAVGPDGEIVVVGRTFADFDGANAGDYDAFVIKLDAAGAEVWRRQFGSAGDDRATAVAIRDDGDVIVAGSTTGSLFGASGNGDGFVARLVGATGATDWAEPVGTASEDEVHAVALGAGGAIFVAGETAGAFPGFVQAGIDDAFVAELDEDGGIVGAHQVGSGSADRGFGLAVLQGGDVVLGGLTNATLPGVLDANVQGVDAFVVRLTPGAPWTVDWGPVQIGHPTEDVSLKGVALADDGDLRLTGETDGDIGTGVFQGGGGDAYAARVAASDGAVGWVSMVGGDGLDRPAALATVSGDATWIVGFTTSTDLGGTVVGTDAFVARFDEGGNVDTTATFGTDAYDAATGIAIAADGMLVVVGETGGALYSATADDDGDAFATKRTY
jgi:hypothetical protein